MKSASVALLLLTLLACDSDPQELPAVQETVPVYFVDGHGLTAIYSDLVGEDAVAALFELLRDGPGAREELRSLLPEGVALIAATETESDESLRLELDETFWAIPAGERFAAAAQIVYTYASLEEGKRILLLDGTVPGELLDGNGQPLPQPLTVESFAELAPWAQVQQPVADATVRHSFPVVARLRAGTTAEVDVLHEGEQVMPPTKMRETTIVNVTPEVRGSIILRITVREDGGAKHTTEIPLELVG